MSHLLTSGQVGNLQTEEEILKIWSSFGLLYGVNEKIKQKLANTYESIAKILLSKDKDLADRLYVHIFPLSRRVVQDLFKDKHKGHYSNTNISSGEELALSISADFIVNKTIEMYYPTITLFEIITRDYNLGSKKNTIDTEAESVAFMSDWVAIQFILSHKDVLK